MSLSTVELLPGLPKQPARAVPLAQPDRVSPPDRPRRLRPVPALEPPYDDEVDAHPRPVLRLVVEAALTLPFDERPAAGGVTTEDTVFAARPTARQDLPDPTRWTARLVQATAEVLAGSRPLQQLRPWTDERVYLQLTGRLRRQGPVTTAPARLRSVHVSEPRDGVAEACAVLGQGPRSRAVALRLEGVDGRWRCTVLQFA